MDLRRAESARRLRTSTALCLIYLVALAGCGGGSRPPEIADRTLVTVWMHSGQEPERNTIVDQVNRFNESQDEVEVSLTVIPEGSYNAQVQAAALSNDLPDLLDFDGPFLYNYVWQGHLLPIDDLLPEEIRNDLLPSILKQGSYRGNRYSIGTFDSGLCLYANQSLLAEVGARIPQTIDDAWTVEEFDSLLEALAKKDQDHAVLDLKVNYTGEWYCYAFSPVVQSAGGDLIERNTYQKAKGSLDSPEAIEAMKHIQAWFQKGYVDPNLDDRSFIDGRVALSWSGHWDYNRYHENIGDDLVLIPLPDFGEGSKTGMGSWNWSITAKAQHPEAAMKFLEFLLEPDEVLAMANANGAVPATRTAIAMSEKYKNDGPLDLFVRQLEKSAVPRPATPAYPVITTVFERAFQQIRHGADVQETLSDAAREIDQDISDNQGYRNLR